MLLLCKPSGNRPKPARLALAGIAQRGGDVLPVEVQIAIGRVAAAVIMDIAIDPALAVKGLRFCQMPG
jgi:hypothetical protein